MSLADPLVFLEVPKIPEIMKNMGWPTASALMQRWFDGPASDDRALQPPDTSDVKMDWVLGFQRAKDVYDKILKERIWMNAKAQTEIARMLRPYRAQAFGNYPFGALSSRVPTIEKSYINTRPVESSISDPLDDLFGALGSFNFRVAIEGSVSRSKPQISTRYRWVPPVNHEVTIKRVGIYVRDSYDFDDDHWYWSQPLGFWRFWGDGDVSKVPIPTYQPVFNSDFRDYRKVFHKGGDFYVYSDIKIHQPYPPDKFEIWL